MVKEWIKKELISLILLIIFFNIRCKQYTEEAKGNSDVTMQSRRDDYYKNVSLCGSGCEYNGMNYSSERANCICEPSDWISSLNLISSYFIANEFLSSLSSMNLAVVKCYNLVFDFDIFIQNLGSWSMLVIGLAQLIAFIYAIVQGVKPILQNLEKMIL